MRSLRTAILYMAAGLVGACNVPLEHYLPIDSASAVCEAPRQICEKTCVDIAASSNHCGLCGHDCGGGACIAGECQPVLIADSAARFDRPAALAVSSTAIFWTESTRVRSCPLPAGCTGEPTLIAGGYFALGALAATEDAVYFTGCSGCTDHHELVRCPATGCPDHALPLTSSTASYDEIVVGKTHAFWRESSATLVQCSHDDCAGTVRRTPSSAFGGDLIGVAVANDTVYVKPSGTRIGSELRSCSEASSSCGNPMIVTSSYQIDVPFRLHAGKAYWLSDTASGRELRVCALANCGSSTTFAADPDASELAVDGTGVYWMADATGAVRWCPLAGCSAAGPITLASGRVGSRQLTLGTGFIYWIEANAIVKLARR